MLVDLMPGNLFNEIYRLVKLVFCKLKCVDFPYQRAVSVGVEFMIIACVNTYTLDQTYSLHQSLFRILSTHLFWNILASPPALKKQLPFKVMVL